MKKESRQRKWQKEKVAKGLCMICGQKQSERSGFYCEAHRLDHNRHELALYHKKKKALDRQVSHA